MSLYYYAVTLQAPQSHFGWSDTVHSKQGSAQECVQCFLISLLCCISGSVSLPGRGREARSGGVKASSEERSTQKRMHSCAYAHP